MTTFVTVFLAVFLAEIGDKTQLTALMFAADGTRSPLLVFVAASAALVSATAIAVVIGGLAQRYVAVLPLKLFAGIGFLAIGAWTLWDHFHAGA